MWAKEIKLIQGTRLVDATASIPTLLTIKTLISPANFKHTKSTERNKMRGFYETDRKHTVEDVFNRVFETSGLAKNTPGVITPKNFKAFMSGLRSAEAQIKDGSFFTDAHDAEHEHAVYDHKPAYDGLNRG